MKFRGRIAQHYRVAGNLGRPWLCLLRIRIELGVQAVVSRSVRRVFVLFVGRRLAVHDVGVFRRQVRGRLVVFRFLQQRGRLADKRWMATFGCHSLGCG